MTVRLALRDQLDELERHLREARVESEKLAADGGAADDLDYELDQIEHWLAAARKAVDDTLDAAKEAKDALDETISILTD